MLTPEEVHHILERLDRRFGVDTLWIFGSEASGTATGDSDLDLAGLFRRRPAPVEVLDARQDLAERLGRDVDLVDLDRASPILAMQVLRHGRLVADREPARRRRFTEMAPGRYEDLMIVRRPGERLLVERVRSGRS